MRALTVHGGKHSKPTRITMTVKISLKTITPALVAGIAILTASCATHNPVDSQDLTEDQWKELASSEMQIVAGSQPMIAPGTLSATKQRKLALKRLAASSIRSDNPGEYTVVRGDTLWDISGRFLSRPWLWPEIWHVNPQIQNPHLIYPGDRIALTYVEGSPRLQLIRASSRPSRQSNPIGTIPADAIEQFLVAPLVVAKSEVMQAPYIAATENGQLIGSTGDHVFARGDVVGSRFSVYRPGKSLVDPDTNEVLGHEAIHVSNASLVKAGDPSKLIITSSTRETVKGDRLMTSEKQAPAYYQPRAATTERSGKIISLVDAVARAAQHQVVVLNLGENDGVQPGDTFSVRSQDRVVRDTVANARSEFFTVEGDTSGVVMVFRTFDRVSYALIMSSVRDLRLYDAVVSTAAEL